MAAAAPEPSQSLDLDRTREIFEASRDFTIGLEEEFALVDPASLELVHRFEELYGACLEDELLAESAAGELIDTEIEIRSGRALTFADAVDRQMERRARLFGLADRLEIALAATGTHPVGQLPRPADHRHRALQPAPRGAAVGGPAQQHLEHARPRRHQRGRSRGRRLRPPARDVAAAAGAVGELAVPRRPRHRPRLGAHRDLHPHLPPLRRARAVRRLGDLRRLHRPAHRHRVGRRGDPALVERAPTSPLRHRRAADLRCADARRGVVRARCADHRLHRAVGARLRRRRAGPAAAPARDRGEPLAGDPLRPRGHPDRLRRARGDPHEARARAAGRVDRSGAGDARARRRVARRERRPAHAASARGGYAARRRLPRGGRRDPAAPMCPPASGS